MVKTVVDFIFNRVMKMNIHIKMNIPNPFIIRFAISQNLIAYTNLKEGFNFFARESV